MARATLRRRARGGGVASFVAPGSIMFLTAGAEANMDKASALLAALRARAVLGGGRLKADAVEALAGVLGLAPEEVPAIVERLGRDGHVAALLHRSPAWVASDRVRPGRAPSTMQGHPSCRSRRMPLGATTSPSRSTG